MKGKTQNTTLSEQFQNQIKKHRRDRGKIDNPQHTATSITSNGVTFFFLLECYIQLKGTLTYRVMKYS